uniref:Uncharacterized protein n=1 Tax=Oryza nivara TaxID=4536 RepID=A0A0E0J9Z2_ORYNI
MATAVEWRMVRRSMGRRPWRWWLGEATRRRGLVARRRRRVEGRLRHATRWTRGRGRRTATGSAHKPARAMSKGFDGGKPPIAGEAVRRTSTEGRWRGRRRRGRARAARKGEGDGAGGGAGARTGDGGGEGDGRRRRWGWRGMATGIVENSTMREESDRDRDRD